MEIFPAAPADSDALSGTADAGGSAADGELR
jgi:hypothetical protein